MDFPGQATQLDTIMTVLAAFSSAVVVAELGCIADDSPTIDLEARAPHPSVDAFTIALRRQPRRRLHSSSLLIRPGC
jgi:hypothetical protein